MARAISRPMSALFAAGHAGWGVTLDFRQGVARFVGNDGKVSGVETHDGRVLPAELVVYGIGVVPNAELATEAGLAVDNGIRVDAQLLTSDPAISAIGDAACFASPHADPAGKPIRLESVQNAVDQGKAVAARLMGKPAPYSALPWFWTDQGDMRCRSPDHRPRHAAHDRTGGRARLRVESLRGGDAARRLNPSIGRGFQLRRRRKGLGGASGRAAREAHRAHQCANSLSRPCSGRWRAPRRHASASRGRRSGSPQTHRCAD